MAYTTPFFRDTLQGDQFANMDKSILTIDGSFGEGGGQVLRSSLALSLVTGKPFVIERIRAGRKKPGLLRQHLTAVTAAAEVGQAEVKGAEVGSMWLEFRPNTIRSGNYKFSIGTAGSATLVLQTVLPALMIADGPSTLKLEGGTHNPFAPPFDFLAKTYLPLVNHLGPRVEACLERPGFYPAGGGCFTVQIQPVAQLGRLELVERGEIIARRVRAVVANLPRHIAERECRAIAKKTSWDESCFAVEEVKNSRGPGNVVMIDLESAALTEVFVGFGQMGVRAEEVAMQALKPARDYLAAGVPVCEHLADQLMVVLGIGASQGTGGGTFRTLALSRHATTNLEILRHFLDIDIQVEANGRDDCMVRIEKK
jgi:RNA 3'-terminal phosphate cyclase (ATP)